MVEAQSMIGNEWTKQAKLVAKQNQQDALFDELLRERAAVLSRAGFAVEDALAKIMKVEQRLEQDMNDLNDLCARGAVVKNDGEKQVIFDRINSVIDEYNEACRKAELQFYYLIVTREAMGLRRHETVRQFYSIPPRKRKLQAI